MKQLTVVLLLNLGLVTALVIVGLTAHSLAVLAAGADYLADAAAIGVSLLAIWLAARPPSRTRPGGYPHATNVAALVNAGWLLVLNILVAAAAVQRLAAGARRVEGLPVLIVSSLAAVVMLAGALVLGDDDGGEDLNIKAVLLDTAADAAAAAGCRGQRRCDPRRPGLVLARPRGCPGDRGDRRLSRAEAGPQGHSLAPGRLTRPRPLAGA